jgi:hypothetical protein
MCVFFSAILTRDGAVRFCDDDSHETVLRRLGWPDDRPLETRGWVRVERKLTDAGWRSVRVDETSMPGWYEEDRARYEGLVCDVADHVQPARAEYEASLRYARMATETVRQSVLAAGWASARQSVRVAYLADNPDMWATHEAIEQPARAKYVKTISSIEGYVPKREGD